MLENPENGGIVVTTSNSSISPSSSTRFSVAAPEGSPNSPLSSSSKNSEQEPPLLEASLQGRGYKYNTIGSTSRLHSESVMTLEDFLTESNKTPKSRVCHVGCSFIENFFTIVFLYV